MYAGQNQKLIGIQFFRQQAAGKIFFNNSTGSAKLCALLENRDSAAATGDHDLACPHERANRVKLYNSLRLRACHNPTITFPRYLGDKVSFLFLLLGLLGGQIAPDDFFRICKGIVIRVDDYLCENGADCFVYAPAD